MKCQSNGFFKLLALILTFFFLGPPAKAQIYVGNGGEGRERNGSLYLRDLVEFDVHQNPYMGSDHKWRSSAPQKQGLLTQIGVEENLLQQKIEDLGELDPTLPEIIRESIKLLSWNLSEQGVARECEPACEALDVGVAARVQHQIYLHRPSWVRLNPANKVALVLHEVFSGYLHPISRDKHAHQQSERIRFFIGQLFTPPTARLSGEPLRTFRQDFMFFDSAQFLKSRTIKGEIRLYPNQVEGFEQPQQVEILQDHETQLKASQTLKSDSNRLRSLRSACLALRPSSANSVLLRVFFETELAAVRRITFSSRFEFGAQTGLGIVRAPWIQQRVFLTRTPRATCLSYLDEMKPPLGSLQLTSDGPF